MTHNQLSHNHIVRTPCTINSQSKIYIDNCSKISYNYNHQRENNHTNKNRHRNSLTVSMHEEAFRPRFSKTRFSNFPLYHLPHQGGTHHDNFTPTKGEPMALTIYFKNGSYIDDCLIDSILYEPECNIIKFTDRFGKQHTRKFSSIACIIIKGVVSDENN